MTSVNLLLVLYLAGVVVFAAIGAAIVWLIRSGDEDPRTLEVKRMLDLVEDQTGLNQAGFIMFLGITWPATLYRVIQKRRQR